jgi:hypothetical protein
MHANGLQNGRHSLRHGVFNGARVKNRGMLDISGGYLLNHGLGQLRGGVPYDLEYLRERLDSKAADRIVSPGNGLQAR